MEKKERKKDEIFTKIFRAGRRTYYFDVKATKENGYYLTITESKKKFEDNDGKFHFEKHKLFLYKEDFDKFSEALSAVMEFAKRELKAEPKIMTEAAAETHEETPVDVAPEITFEDLHEEPQLATETSQDSFHDITFEDLKAEPQIATETNQGSFADITFEDLKNETLTNEDSNLT